MKGFRDAAQDAESTQFSTMLKDSARERSQVATALQGEVKRLGGNPEEDSSFLAAAHRTFMDIKQAFTGKDEKAVIQEVERGEDYIKGKFEGAFVKRRSKGTPDRRRRGTPFSDNMMLVC